MAKKSSKGLLAEQTFLFTGTLLKLTRAEAEKMVKVNGGSVLSDVSDKLNYLVVGKDAGSKFEKAKKLKRVKVITEKEFLKLVNSKLASNTNVKATIKSKTSGKGSGKKYKLNYWLDNRLNYFTDNYKEIILNKCDQSTSWGSHSFYIEVSSGKNIHYHLDHNNLKLFGFEDEYNYLKYEQYCDGLGTIEIITNDPKSVIPNKVKNGLIQSVIDSSGNVFEIFDGEFCGEINNYDTPEFNEGIFIISGNKLSTAEIKYNKIVPENYNRAVLLFEFYLLILKYSEMSASYLKSNLKVLSEYFQSLPPKEFKKSVAIAKEFIEARKIIDFVSEIKDIAFELKKEHAEYLSKEPRVLTNILEYLNVGNMSNLKSITIAVDKIFGSKLKS